MFESSVIDANESLSRPRCEKMNLKTIQSMLEKVQIRGRPICVFQGRYRLLQIK